MKKILFNPQCIEKIPITSQMLAVAEAKDPHRPYNNKSFMKGEGIFVGILGEEIVKSWRIDFSQESTYDYDLVCFCGSKKQTIDVKTKYQSSPNVPLKDIGGWMASVCVDSIHQNTDFYIFCRVCKIDTYGNGFSYPFGWIAGMISKDEFFKKAVFRKKGEKEGYNNYTVQQDCYNVPYSELYQLDSRLKW